MLGGVVPSEAGGQGFALLVGSEVAMSWEEGVFCVLIPFNTLFGNSNFELDP